MQQAIQDYAAEMKQEEDWKMEILREKELAAQEKARSHPSHPCTLHPRLFIYPPSLRGFALRRESILFSVGGRPTAACESWRKWVVGSVTLTR